MRRRRRRIARPSHDRWLVSYADFITLLFAFFVVMYSTSQVDKRKVGKLAVAIQVAFQQLGAFPSSNSQIPLNLDEPVPLSAVQAIENAKRTAALGRIAPSPGEPTADPGNLNDLRRDLEKALAAEISRHEVDVRPVPDGLVISLREIGFFASGSAEIQSKSLGAFSRIAALLQERPYRIRIEGHTDNAPIHNAQFPSNWELSTSRSTELVRRLIVNYGFAPERLAAAGYAQYHPVTSNDTAEGRAQNRRVDVVVLGKVEAERRAVPLFGGKPSPMVR